MNDNHYDIIFTGGGAASRMVLYYLKDQAEFQDRKILFIEKENKTSDKTWCFWFKNHHPLQHIITKSWGDIEFKSKDIARSENIHPYRYACIFGSSFEQYTQEEILPRFSRIEICNDTVLTTAPFQNTWTVKTSLAEYTCDLLISNLPFISKKKILHQQFLGWFVEFNEDVFDEDKALLMDFSCSKEKEFSFFYILPFSKRKALIECTFYSASRIDSQVYVPEIEAYIQAHFGSDYSLTSIEVGSIPLQTISISEIKNQSGHLNIGQRSGTIKSSTGYAFQRMLDDASLIGGSLFNNNPRRRKSKSRHLFYDELLLKMIEENPDEAKNTFSRLFQTSSFSSILKFLDEKTNLMEEIKIFIPLKWWPFLKRIKFFR